MLALHVLASGSKGNASIIEDVSTGHGVLIDCGICKRDILNRCEEANFNVNNLDAILITHEHSDHTKCLGVVTRELKKHGITAPLYALPEVLKSSRDISSLDNSIERHPMALNVPCIFGSIAALPFRTSHDAAASCGFIFTNNGNDSIGYITDTGFLTPEAKEHLKGVRILAIESNHDERMLKNGEYPGYLKERILSELGHLSNAQSAKALEMLATSNLEQVVAMHISENNNLPSIAKKALQETIDELGYKAQVRCSAQYMLVSVK